MRVQLHAFGGVPVGPELPQQIPWGDYLTWNRRVFRRAADDGEHRCHRLQHFHEVDVLDLTLKHTHGWHAT